MKTSSYFLMLALLLSAIACRKENKSEFVGTFELTILEKHGSESAPAGPWNFWDTTYLAEGSVMHYQSAFGDSDLYKKTDDLNENALNKISLMVDGEIWINSLIDDNGKLIPKSTYSNPFPYNIYAHSGDIYGDDSLAITIHLSNQGFSNKDFIISGKKK